MVEYPAHNWLVIGSTPVRPTRKTMEICILSILGSVCVWGGDIKKVAKND